VPFSWRVLAGMGAPRTVNGPQWIKQAAGAGEQQHGHPHAQQRARRRVYRVVMGGQWAQAVGVCRLLACHSQSLNGGPPPRQEPDAAVTAVSWLAGLVARLLPAATEDASSIELVRQGA